MSTRVSCRPVLGGRLPPKSFLLTLFLFTLSPLPLGYSPQSPSTPPQKVKSCRKPWVLTAIFQDVLASWIIPCQHMNQYNQYREIPTLFTIMSKLISLAVHWMVSESRHLIGSASESPPNDVDLPIMQVQNSGARCLFTCFSHPKCQKYSLTHIPIMN